MNKLEIIGLSLIIIMVLLVLALFIIKKIRHDEIQKRVNKLFNMSNNDENGEEQKK